MMKNFLFFLLVLIFSASLSQAQPIDPSALDSMKTYTSLESALKNPDQVYKLKLSKQDLTEFPMEILKFKNLMALDLSRNKIKVIPDEIGNLKHLRILNLSRNKIHDIPTSIGQLTELRALIMNQNEIEVIPKEIGKLVNLEYLDLWDNNLFIIPDELKNLKALKELDLRNIQFNQREQDRIRALVPHAKVHMDPACNCH
jgi:leucine-rich repeat protein SHOC2